MLAALKGKQAAFDMLNSFGSEVSHSHDHVTAAATDVEVLRKLVQKEQAKDLVCGFRRMAVRLAHLAHAVAAERREHGRQPGTARCRGWVARGAARLRGLAGAGKKPPKKLKAHRLLGKSAHRQGPECGKQPPKPKPRGATAASPWMMRRRWMTWKRTGTM